MFYFFSLCIIKSLHEVEIVVNHKNEKEMQCVRKILSNITCNVFSTILMLFIRILYLPSHLEMGTAVDNLIFLINIARQLKT